MSKGFIKIQLLIIFFILFVLAIIALLAFFSGQVEARDRIRVIDIGQIQKALGLYFQENGIYPSAENNIPRGLDNYLEKWPIAPSPDGTCTTEQNNYVYAQKLAGEDYALTFCLGGESADLTPGVHTLSAKSIK